jgi:hypothetical protein
MNSIFQLLALAFLVGQHSAFADEIPYFRCGEFSSVGDVCSVYRASGGLRNDPVVQKAAIACEAYEHELNASIRLVCDYRAEANASRAGGPSVSPSSCVALAGAEGRRAVYVRYFAAAGDQIVKLSIAASNYEKLIFDLAEHGAKVFQTELDCYRDGTPGAGEGAQVIGLAKAALEWKRESSQPALYLTAVFKNRMYIYERNATFVGPALEGLPAGLVSAPPKEQEAVDTPELLEKAKPRIPYYSPAITASGSVQDYIGDMSEVSVRALLKAEVETVGHEAEEEAMKKAGSVLDLLLEEGVIGTFVGTGIKVASQKDWDALFLANLGAGMVMTVMGTPFLPALGVSAAADALEMHLRKMWAIHQAGIIAPYVQYVKTVPDADSGMAAKGYKSRKLVPDNCFDSKGGYFWLLPRKPDFDL